jgi:HAD superfamily hydrolase (TIGR01490 family)
MKKTAAVFDFDGTITSRDTFNDFILYNFGVKNFILAFLIMSPFIFLYIIGVLKNDTPKKIIFYYFFRNMKFSYYKKICISYSKSRLIKFLKPEALTRINWHMKCNHTLIINSASLADWINPWALKNGFKHIIATSVEIKDNLLTGRFIGPCPYGAEKVIALSRLGFNSNQYIIYAYGNSNGDKELLKIADYPFYRTFS